MKVSFSKYHGIGNDFVLIEDVDPGAMSDEAVKSICDRHRGVGADGVLFVDTRKPAMVVRNSDGSRPEMCGNGIRCVALHLFRSGLVTLGTAFSIDTDAGPHVCTVVSNTSESAAQISVIMRAPEAAAPMEMEVDGIRFEALPVSMGNPHVVLFEDLQAHRHWLGPRLERDPAFPEGTNVNFARMHPDGSIDLHVWERGAGWTQACGTGACATATAAVLTERCKAGTPIRVKLPGGLLEITVPVLRGSIQMVGPAAHVFCGEVEHSLTRT